MIPQEKIPAVTRGLREAFGVTEFEDIRKLANIFSSVLVFRIVVRGTPFLLRIIMRTDDPTCHFTCMKAAAKAGLAPRVWYTSVEDRLSITDFVEAVAFPVTEALVRIAKTLRILHALPPFPTRAHHLNTTCTFLLHKGAALDGFIERIQIAKVLSTAQGDELFAGLALLTAIYPHDDRDMVSSHNDLFKPDNILFDGARVWLVDWEAAFLNDRYADLAVVANLVAANEADERSYLQDYFGRPPNQYEQARFLLMQQVSHAFYAMAFLLLGSSGKQIDWSEPVPEFQDFQQRIWAGEVSLADNHTKTVYGRVHCERFLKNMQQPEFKQALKVLA